MKVLKRSRLQRLPYADVLIYTPPIPLPVCPKLIKSNKDTASWGEGAAGKVGEKEKSSEVLQKGQGEKESEQW